MKEFIIRTGIFDRKRKLILSEGYIEYEDKDSIGNEFTRFEIVFSAYSALAGRRPAKAGAFLCGFCA